jgi:hypothetical protein
MIVLLALAPIVENCGGQEANGGTGTNDTHVDASSPEASTGTMVGGSSSAAATPGSSSGVGSSSSGISGGTSASSSGYGAVQVACVGAPSADAGSCDPVYVMLDGGPVEDASGVTVHDQEVFFPCGLPQPVMPPSCSQYCGPDYDTRACEVTCGGVITVGLLPWFVDNGGGTVGVMCDVTPTASSYEDAPIEATGRRPAGLVEHHAVVACLGEALAQQAHLEAAAVEAFLELAGEMMALGAPSRLVRRLQRAAADEVRHARIASRLARARGGEPASVKIVAPGRRSLFAIALHNAREGCVRETWGAACAVAQGERALDPEVRAAMRRIAHDELGHAALSWDLAAWLETRLTPTESAAVAAERERAIDALEAEIATQSQEPWMRQLGLPCREDAQRILASMRSEMWGSRAAA